MAVKKAKEGFRELAVTAKEEFERYGEGLIKRESPALIGFLEAMQRLQRDAFHRGLIVGVGFAKKPNKGKGKRAKA